jgi:hypothetical protein
VFGRRRSTPEDELRAAKSLTAAQRRLRAKLDARIGPADGCRWGEVYLYTGGDEGTTRLLVSRDGTVLDSTAWSRERA